MSTRHGSSGFPLRFSPGWMLFQVSVWSLCAIWLYPALLGHVGLSGAATWIAHHSWLRALAFPPLALLLIVSAFNPVDTGPQRESMEAAAATLGGTVVESGETGGFDHGAIVAGPGMRAPIGPWTLDVSRLVQSDRARVMARVEVRTTGPFGFTASGSDTGHARLGRIGPAGMRVALGLARGDGADPLRRGVAESLSYLADPPTSTGVPGLDEKMSLWTNDPARARLLFADAAVREAIERLGRVTTRWQWMLAPALDARPGELALWLPGSTLEPEAIGIAHAVLEAALHALVEGGSVVAPDDRGHAAAA